MAKDDVSVDELSAKLSKKHDVPIGTYADVVQPVVGLTTGNIAIDYITGVGGLPQGRITELYGLPSSGKTTTALMTAANLQRKIISGGGDEYILYLDFEHALDLEYASNLGLDLAHKSFVTVQPNWLEQGAEIALDFINTGKIRMSIWDSVAAMTPKALIEGDFDQRTNAMNRARLLSGLLQRLASLLHEQRCAGVFINHLMEAVAMAGGRPGMPPQTTTPGGRGLKYYASLRLEYKQAKSIKGSELDLLGGGTSEQLIANQVIVKNTKNKIGKPSRVAEVRNRYGRGFDNAWTALQVLVAHGQISRSSAGYYGFADVADLIHPDMATSARGIAQIHGEPGVLLFADLHPQWRARLVRYAEELIEDYGTSVIVDPGALDEVTA